MEEINIEQLTEFLRYQRAIPQDVLVEQMNELSALSDGLPPALIEKFMQLAYLSTRDQLLLLVDCSISTREKLGQFLQNADNQLSVWLEAVLLATNAWVELIERETALEETGELAARDISAALESIPFAAGRTRGADSTITPRSIQHYHIISSWARADYDTKLVRYWNNENNIQSNPLMHPIHRQWLAFEGRENSLEAFDDFAEPVAERHHLLHQLLRLTNPEKRGEIFREMPIFAKASFLSLFTRLEGLATALKNLLLSDIIYSNEQIYQDRRSRKTPGCVHPNIKTLGTRRQILTPAQK